MTNKRTPWCVWNVQYLAENEDTFRGVFDEGFHGIHAHVGIQRHGVSTNFLWRCGGKTSGGQTMNETLSGSFSQTLF